MLKLGLSALFALGLVGAAFAQAPTDHVKIDVTRAETAVPLLIELQKQIEAQTSKAAAVGGGGGGSSLPNSAAPVKK